MKLKVKKLRGKDIIFVDPQIDRWRKTRKHEMVRVETPRQRAVKAAKKRKDEAIRKKLYNLFGND